MVVALIRNKAICPSKNKSSLVLLAVIRGDVLSQQVRDTVPVAFPLRNGIRRW